jgi:hypothetical protein
LTNSSSRRSGEGEIKMDNCQYCRVIDFPDRCDKEDCSIHKSTYAQRLRVVISEQKKEIERFLQALEIKPLSTTETMSEQIERGIALFKHTQTALGIMTITSLHAHKMKLENERYESALLSILNRGTGRCTADGVTTTTLRKIAEEALANTKKENGGESNG